MQTAEEFIKNFHRQEGHTFEQTVPVAMIEFAKLHVEAALKIASNKFDYYFNKNAILNAYPLTNIK